MTIHEDGICKGCGQPRDRSWNGDMEGEYVAHRATCLGCEAAHLAKEARPLGAAEVLFVTDEAPPDKQPDPRMMTVREE